MKIWRKLVPQDKTLLRSMEDDEIAGLHLQGRVLDIGGGADFDYTRVIRNHVEGSFSRELKLCTRLLYRRGQMRLMSRTSHTLP
jgi:hypothetical protein